MAPWALALLLAAAADDETSAEVAKNKSQERKAQPRPRLKLPPYVPGARPEPPDNRDLLHFTTEVEVEGHVKPDPNESLRALLAGLPLRTGPTQGAPTRSDMELYRPHTSPSADFLPLLAWLAGKLANSVGLGREHRYFVYELRSAGHSMALMREEAIPLEAEIAFPQLKLRLMGEFTDKKEAIRAFRDLEAASRAAKP